MQIPPGPPVIPTRRSGRRNAIVAGVAIVAVGASIAVVLMSHRAAASTTPSSVSNDPNKTGCPAAVADVTWSHPADVTLTQQDANKSTPAHGGATVEIDLPAGYFWSFVGGVNSGSAGAISPISPAGVYESTGNLCAWRFIAPASGVTMLHFERRCLPQPGKLCSDIVIIYAFVLSAS